MPSNTRLVSGPAVGAAQTLIWFFFCVFLPPMLTAVRSSVFSFVGTPIVFYTFHRHWVYLFDHVDLICSLYSWWEGLGPLSNSAHGFQLWFYLHLFMWVINRGLLLRLLWRTWTCPSEGWVWRGAVACALEAPGTQGVGLGQEEIWCSTRAWQPTPTFFPEKSPGQTNLEGHSPQKHKELDKLKWPFMQRPRTFSSFLQLCPRGDHAWRWHRWLDHGNAGYIGSPVAMATGDVVLLGIFLACNSSAPVRTEHEGGSAA